MTVAVAVIVIVCIIVCGLISAGTALLCKLHEMCRKNRVKHAVPCTAGRSSGPQWSQRLAQDPVLARHGFAQGPDGRSDGLTLIGPNHVIRHRPGNGITDTARMAVGITSGKHIFEFKWPWGVRGSEATVGVVTEMAPVRSSRGTSPSAMVGRNRFSWGLDIVNRRAFHNNRFVCACPTDGSFVPESFLMYLDMDLGVLGFGSAFKFWGNIITGLPARTGNAVYITVATNTNQAQVQVIYRGSAGATRSNPLHTVSSGAPPQPVEPLASAFVPPALVHGTAPPKTGTQHYTHVSHNIYRGSENVYTGSNIVYDGTNRNVRSANTTYSDDHNSSIGDAWFGASPENYVYRYPSSKGNSPPPPYSE